MMTPRCPRSPCRLHQHHEGPCDPPADTRCRFCELEHMSCLCGALPAPGPSDRVTNSKPHPLDATALKKRLEDRDTVIAVLRDRCNKLEGAITKYLNEAEISDDVAAAKLAGALEVLPPEKLR